MDFFIHYHYTTGENSLLQKEETENGAKKEMIKSDHLFFSKNKEN
jgi:hypothetical protein